jgi:predicted transposase YbfD/YdcC
LFAATHIEWFRRFMEVEQAPSHDTFSRVFALLNPRVFEAHFIEWTCGVAQTSKGQVVAIDGKCLRRSMDYRKGQRPFHIVSAWASVNGVALAQTAVDAKSNEIPAARALIKMLDLTGVVVTADALHCVPATVELIVEQGGDYVISLKNNRPLTLREVQAEFAAPIFPVFDTLEASRGHGRMELRQVEAMQARVAFGMEWQGAKSIVRVQASRTINEETKLATRYYISSLAPDHVELIAKAVRAHWSIENSQHWVLDMVFREDECRVHEVNASANFSMLRRIALNTLKVDDARHSVKSKRLLAGWSEAYREKLLGLSAQ